ncbi:sugar ABC transporter ATP-binding protein [Aerococcus urinaehominis]|uniref:Sugar ABC transporter ATP-binding protein n=1 Tax=Aerococcus urinaehominis TaxID=128944 RepID=A0A120IAV8_9LACT|nr:ABC transporter ATP-binding protein [Aerococcus urinaehominis]AMB99296.1 sugar ABC transporter ATP-binding protein [Aerococcus urinaehominis]SDM19339.1 ATP-binding cassette, subfamily B [Aerococcus urinaehominis]
MQTATLKLLINYIKPQKGRFFAMLVLAVLSVVFQIIIPIQIGRAVNVLLGYHQVDFAEVSRQIFILVGLTLGAVLAQFGQNELVNRLTYQISYQLRQNVFLKIQKLPLSYLDRHPYGDIVSRAINDVDLTSNGLLQTFTSLFTGLATIIGIVIIMLSLNWKIGLIVIILTPLSVIVSTIIANGTYRHFQNQVQLRGEMGAYIDEIANNQYLVKALAYQDRSQVRFDDINNRLHHSGVISQFYGALINPTARVLNALVYAAVGIYGALSVINGQLSVGLYSSFLTYAHQYTQPFNEISAVVNEMQMALAAAHRIFDFLGQPEEKASPATATISQPHGDISIQNLYFSYVSDQKLIEDFSVQVKAGDTVAIVGPTGAGKSTLINLLMRFYEPNAGQIFIDGIDSQDLSRDNVRSLFGMVLQDAWIFAGTVRDNIAYGNPEASLDQIIAAAKQASLHRLIEQLPQGYDTWLEEEGANISTGQKQLICIARIILTDPDMLILDEATSSIDTVTEQAVQASFDQLMEGRTTFIVAHRLSTIQKADTILVLDQGQVIEQGSHQELLDQGGFYHQLYYSQFDTDDKP